MAGSYKDAVNTLNSDNSRGTSRSNRKGKDPQRVQPQTVEESPEPTFEDKLRTFIEDHYDDMRVAISNLNGSEKDQKYICEVLLENRMTRNGHIKYNMTGGHQEELAEDMLKGLKQELVKEREREKGAQDRLMKHVEKRYDDFCLVKQDLMAKARDPSEHSIPAKRYFVKVCLFRGSEEFVRCGEFGLTRAQGYSFEQAMQKALDLLKFKENNDLLYMNELKGYYKEEPDYFDEKYQKKLLTRIGKGDIVIPESCVGNAVKATLERNRPKVSQSQSNALDAPTESTPGSLSRWYPRRRETNSITNSGTSPSESHNPLSQAFASLSTKISGSGRKDDRLSTPSSATREHEERHRAAQVSERRDIPPTIATTSTAPPRRTSSISSPSTSHFAPRDPKTTSAASLGTKVLTRQTERKERAPQESLKPRKSVTSTPAAVATSKETRSTPISRESRVAARAANIPVPNHTTTHLRRDSRPTDQNPKPARRGQDQNTIS